MTELEAQDVRRYIYERITVCKESGCWNWSTNSKYGAAKFKGEVWIASRLSFMAFYKEIPRGLFVCHKCDNGKCVNPAHLFSGTPKENSQDMVKKDRLSKHQRPFGSDHGRTHLTEKDVLEIRRLVKIRAASEKELATRYDVAVTTISAIVTRRNWKHLP